MPTYIVRSGDTLAAIAARYNTSVQAIVDANRLANPDMIHVGQHLVLTNGVVPAGNGLTDGADFVVGSGIAQAMNEDGTTAGSDEVYVHGNRTNAQWSEAMGLNGTLYRWVDATNEVLRFPSHA
jgi:murein DD-endopeptidase MepM/ murein hydrolase activator NlpD